VIEMKKRTVQALWTALVFGAIGMSLSILHQEQWVMPSSLTQTTSYYVSYGYPTDCYGYKGYFHNSATEHSTETHYWFSLESFMYDAAFWFALSFFGVWGTWGVIDTAKSLQKRRASKNLSVINIWSQN
jgi:hypothetical protein